MSTERSWVEILQLRLLEASEEREPSGTPPEGQKHFWQERQSTDAGTAARNAAWVTQALTSSKDPSSEHFAIATAGLLWAGSDRNPQGADALAREALEGTESRSRLAALVLEHASQIATEVLADDPRTGGSSPEGPMLRWDEVFADALDRLGPSGSAAAATVRVVSTQRSRQLPLPGTASPHLGELWRLWLLPLDDDAAETPRWIHMLARVLWLDMLRPRLVEERRKPAALPGSLFEQLARVQRPGGRLAETSRGIALVDGDGGHVADLRGDMRVAAVHLEAISAMVRDGARMLGSLNAHRTVRWMVSTAHQRAMEGEPDARVLMVDGGWSALAELVGARSKKAADDIKAIIAAMASLDFPLPDGSTGDLLTRRDRPAVGQRSARVEITLGTALLPHYVHGLPKGNRALVPMPALPPLIGRERDHGAQAVLQLQVMAELRRRAKELAAEGYVYLPRSRWEQLAEEASLPAGVLSAVIERWTHDGEDGPAFLALVGHDRYTLSDAHGAIRAFLVDAGKLELEGAEAGRKSVRRKRGRLLKEPAK